VGQSAYKEGATSKVECKEATDEIKKRFMAQDPKLTIDDLQKYHTSTIARNIWRMEPGDIITPEQYTQRMQFLPGEGIQEVIDKRQCYQRQKCVFDIDKGTKTDLVIDKMVTILASKVYEDEKTDNNVKVLEKNRKAHEAKLLASLEIIKALVPGAEDWERLKDYEDVEIDNTTFSRRMLEHISQKGGPEYMQSVVKIFGCRTQAGSASEKGPPNDRTILHVVDAILSKGVGVTMSSQRRKDRKGCDRVMKRQQL
jgi:hypothetical protein